MKEGYQTHLFHLCSQPFALFTLTSSSTCHLPHKLLQLLLAENSLTLSLEDVARVLLDSRLTDRSHGNWAVS